MKKIKPLRILHKYGKNSYVVELPPNLGISPILNVFDLYPYKGPPLDLSKTTLAALEDDDWVKDLPTPKPMQLESILDTKVLQKTRRGN